MTTRKPESSDIPGSRIADLLRASPPIEHAPAWLRASTMERIARANARAARLSSTAEYVPQRSILWRLAPVAAVAALIAVIAFIAIPGAPPPTATPSIPPAPLVSGNDSSPRPSNDIASPATIEAFRTLQALARRPDLQPAALVHNRVEAPLLREARLVVQDTENVARAVLARLPITPTIQ